MRSTVSLIFTVIGVVFLILALSASESIGSQLKHLFTGAPTDRTVWYLIAAVVFLLLGAGSYGVMRDPK